jgi:hypothetical protein
LTTTQIYLTPRKEDVIRRVVAHHAEQTQQANARTAPVAASGYRRESLDVLFRVTAVTVASATTPRDWGSDLLADLLSPASHPPRTRAPTCATSMTTAITPTKHKTRS